ncbi:MAG: hypothetical protein ACXIUW_17870 [Roseinatronobacter sp.]
MPEEQTQTDRDPETSKQIEKAIERELTRLVASEGHDPDLVLGRALAVIFTLITIRHGGNIAAAVARNAADQCRGYPSFSETPLASMQPMGRA